MAVKAIFAIKSFEPEGDLTYRANVQIWVNGHDVPSVINTTFFSPTDTSAAVNMSLNNFVQAYAEDNWNVTFGMLDTVKCLNPVSLL
jgi:hypothetical protein